MRKKSKEFDRRKKDKAKKNNVRNRSNKKKRIKCMEIPKQTKEYRNIQNRDSDRKTTSCTHSTGRKKRGQLSSTQTN